MYKHNLVHRDTYQWEMPPKLCIEVRESQNPLVSSSNNYSVIIISASQTFDDESRTRRQNSQTYQLCSP